MSECKCNDKEESLFWNGESCVKGEECPCFYNERRYEQGSIFTNEDCESCECNPGGVILCTQKEDCPKCLNPNQHPELAYSSCDCICKECETGTKLCPTDGICIKESFWCNGIDDCSDDERNCPTTPSYTTQPVTSTTTAKSTTYSTTTTEPKCPISQCPPHFILQETEIETLEGCPVYKCHYKSIACPAVMCPHGLILQYIELPETIFPGGSVNSGQSSYGQEEGQPEKLIKNSYTSEINEFEEDFSQIENDVTTGDKTLCPKYRCISPPTTATTSTSTTSSTTSSTPLIYTHKISTSTTTETSTTSTSTSTTSFTTYTTTTSASTTTRSTSKSTKQTTVTSTMPIPIPLTIWSKCIIEGSLIDTFDGSEVKYETCNHILAKGISNDWTVSIINDCQPNRRCKMTLKIQHEEETFEISDTEVVIYKNNRYSIQQMSQMQNKKYSLRPVGSNLVFVSKVFGFKVVLTACGRIEIHASPSQTNNIHGLCGFFNDESSDDKQMPDGQLTDSSQVFGDSWKVPGSTNCKNEPTVKTCSEEDREQAVKICNVQIRYPPFDKCNAVLDFEKISARCVESTCKCLKREAANPLQGRLKTCRCEIMSQVATECLRQDDEIEIKSWRMTHHCPSQCPRGMIYHDCHRSNCEKTCEALDNTCSETEDSSICFPGCFCPRGMVKKDNGCIRESQCRDCVCNINMPGQDYQTYDSKSFKILNSNCSYIATKQTDFEIRFSNQPCTNKPQSFCVFEIEVLTADNDIKLLKKDEKVVLQVDGSKLVNVEQRNSIYQTQLTSSGGVTLSMTLLSIEVVYDHYEGSFVIKAPSSLYGGTLKGLCGNCDRKPENDLEGLSIEQFANKWRTKTCDTSRVPRSPDECLNEQNGVCDKLQGSYFSTCNPILSPEEFIRDCKKEFCQTPDYTICDAMKRYASSCYEIGVCISYRKQENCPIPQCSSDKEYVECPDDCDRTCDDVLDDGVDLSIYARNMFGMCEVESQGCFCPEGQVILDGVCVEESKCFTCKSSNGEIRNLGEEWIVDKCTTCSCTKDDMNSPSVNCISESCKQTEIVCQPGFKSEILSQNENECCEKYHCVPMGLVCTDLKTPNCKENQVIKKIEGGGGNAYGGVDQCPTYVCECIPKSECPMLNDTLGSLLQPGEEVITDHSDCCPRNKIKCNKSNCPNAPKCPKFHSRIVKGDGKSCCPIYECEPPNACIVKKNETSSNSYGISETFETSRLVQPFESWNEGPCRKCLCLGQNGSQPTQECVVETCPKLERKDQYNYETYNPIDKCCPEIRKTGCKFQDTLFYSGDSLVDPTDPCVTYECILENGEILMEVKEQNCDGTCPKGWVYKTIEEKCCGKCEQEYCVREDNGQLVQVGQKWTTGDGCVTHTCVNMTGTFQIVTQKPVCQDVKDCNGEISFDPTGCCEICIPKPERIGDCEAIVIEAENTLRLVKENNPIRGICQNEEPIEDFKQCMGHCESKTTYISGLTSQESSCTCCQMDDDETKEVSLKCEDGTYITKEIKVAKTCNCQSCLSQATTTTEAAILY